MLRRAASIVMTLFLFVSMLPMYANAASSGTTWISGTGGTAGAGANLTDIAYNGTSTYVVLAKASSGVILSSSDLDTLTARTHSPITFVKSLSYYHGSFYLLGNYPGNATKYTSSNTIIATIPSLSIVHKTIYINAKSRIYTCKKTTQKKKSEKL